MLTSDVAIGCLKYVINAPVCDPQRKLVHGLVTRLIYVRIALLPLHVQTHPPFILFFKTPVVVSNCVCVRVCVCVCVCPHANLSEVSISENWTRKLKL